MTPVIARRRVLRAAVALAALPAFVRAQARYPSKPISIIVPFTPGGSADIFARVLGQDLSIKLGQPVVVVNKPGLAGNIGAAETARAAADGHTLLYTTAAIAVSQSLYPDAKGFAMYKDLVPVAMVAAMPHILITKKSLPVKTPQELVALLRANPGRYNYSSAGPGTSAHLSMELFKKVTGTSALHIPYRGGAPAMTAVIAGEVDFALLSSFQALPTVKAGRVNALAVSSQERSSVVPDLPTLRSMNINVVSYQWHGLFAPVGVSNEIIETLHRETQTWLAKPSTIEKIHADGSEPMPQSLQATSKFVNAEIDKWAQVVKFSGVKPE